LRLTFLGKTAQSGDSNCPSLYRDDDGSYLVVGKVVDDTVLSQIKDLGDDEAVVRVPADVLLFSLLPNRVL
jgi:hypothetical protein